MTPNELSVLLNELLLSISSSSLFENEVFIKRIWTTSKELGVIPNNSEGRKLLSEGADLWNKTIHMRLTLPEGDSEGFEITAMLRDTCYQVFRMSETWKKDNFWEYLEVLNTMFRMWMDCDRMQNTTNIAEELQKINELQIDKCAPDQIRQLFQCFVYQSEYAARSDNWSQSIKLFEKATDLLSSIPLSQDKSIDMELLYHTCLETGFSLLNSEFMKSTRILCCISNLLKKVMSCCSEASFPYHLQDYLMNLIINACEKDDHKLTDTQLTQIICMLDNSISDKTILKYFMVKVYVISKLQSAASSTTNAIKILLQHEYFEAVEKVQISDIAEQTHDLAAIIYKLGQSDHFSLAEIMSGMDLLIQRATDKFVAKRGSLYVLKIYILHELVLLKKGQNFDEAVLKSAMDDIFLFKDEISRLDLESIQMILWRTGDDFYKRKMYQVALPWYRYTWGITVSSPRRDPNLLTLSCKLTKCYDELDDGDSAYEYLQRALRGPDNQTQATAEEYLLLIKYAFRQNRSPQESVIPPLLERLVKSLNFDAGSMLIEVLEYCHEYGTKTAVLIGILNVVLSCYDKDCNLRAKKAFTHQLVLVLKCLIHIKTTVYEKIHNDGKSRTKKLACKSITSYMKSICQILSDMKVDMMGSNCIIASDLEWLMQTAYNLGLFCFSLGRNEEGAAFFNTIERVSTFYGADIAKSLTSEQNRIYTFLSTCSRLLVYHQEKVMDKEKYATASDFSEMLTKLDSLINHGSEGDRDALSYLGGLLKVEVCVKMGQFDQATKLFEEHELLSECPFSVLERMAGIVLHNSQCPIENAFYILKKLQPKLVKENNTKDYAKWTRILVYTAIARKNVKDVYDCIESVVNQEMYKKEDYPQNELYYLIVITWNEGITCCFRSDSHGKNWCNLAFKLLSNFKDVTKKLDLESKMNCAYEMFKK